MAKKSKIGINEATLIAWVFAIGLHFTPGAIWNHISLGCGIVAGALTGSILTIKRQDKVKWDKDNAEKKRKQDIKGFTVKELEDQLKKIINKY